MTAIELENLRNTWKQHLEAWKHSGRSQVDYCREKGLKPHQLTYWKKRFQKSEASAKWIPLNPFDSPQVGTAAVAVVLPDGIRLEVPSEQATELLPKLLSALRVAP